MSNSEIKTLIADTVDEYPLTTAMTAADNAVLLKIRDTVNQRTGDFNNFRVDSLGGDTIAANVYIEVKGTGA